MLRLTKEPSGDFRLDETGTSKSIPIPRDIAGKIKEEAHTAGELVKKLYEEFGNVTKYKEILDRNLKPQRTKSAGNNVKQLFDDFQKIV